RYGHPQVVPIVGVGVVEVGVHVQPPVEVFEVNMDLVVGVGPGDGDGPVPVGLGDRCVGGEDESATFGSGGGGADAVAEVLVGDDDVVLHGVSLRVVVEFGLR